MKVKDWLDTIERNTPTNCPHLSCGWPDEEHGITWDNYINELICRLEHWVRASRSLTSLHLRRGRT